MTQTLQVTAARLGEPAVPGRINTIDAESASLRFDVETPPTFACGELVRLDFVHDEPEKPLSIHSVVRSRSDVADPTIEFEFLDWMSVREQLPPALLPVFSNRRNPRAEPSNQTDLCVLLVTVPGRNKIPAEMRDISRDGMGVWLDPAFERAVHPSQAVTVQFRLPTYPYDLLLGAVVRHQQEVDGRMAVGLVFDQDTTVEFEEQQGIINHYIQHVFSRPADDAAEPLDPSSPS